MISLVKKVCSVEPFMLEHICSLLTMYWQNNSIVSQHLPLLGLQELLTKLCKKVQFEYFPLELGVGHMFWIRIVLAGSIVLTPRDHLIILSSCEYSQCPPLRGWWDFQLDRVLIGSSRGARAQSVRGNNLNNLYQTHTFPSQSNWIPGTFSSLIIWLRNGKFNIPTLMFIWYFLFWAVVYTEEQQRRTWYSWCNPSVVNVLNMAEIEEEGSSFEMASWELSCVQPAGDNPLTVTQHQPLLLTW